MLLTVKLSLLLAGLYIVHGIETNTHPPGPNHYEDDNPNEPQGRFGRNNEFGGMPGSKPPYCDQPEGPTPPSTPISTPPSTPPTSFSAPLSTPPSTTLTASENDHPQHHHHHHHDHHHHFDENQNNDNVWRGYGYRHNFEPMPQYMSRRVPSLMPQPIPDATPFMRPLSRPYHKPMLEPLPEPRGEPVLEPLPEPRGEPVPEPMPEPEPKHRFDLGKIRREQIEPLWGQLSVASRNFLAPDSVNGAIPAHCIKRIVRYCSRNPESLRCRNHPEWISEDIVPSPPSHGDVCIEDEDEVFSLYNFTAAVPPKFPPKFPPKNVLANVPEDLRTEVNDNPVYHLSSSERSSMSSSCSYGNCLKQPKSALFDRADIAEHHATVTRFLTDGAGKQIDKDVETQFLRTYQLKKAILAKLGLEGKVEAANDGIFQGDILLSIDQADILINAVQNGVDVASYLPSGQGSGYTKPVGYQGGTASKPQGYQSSTYSKPQRSTTHTYQKTMAEDDQEDRRPPMVEEMSSLNHPYAHQSTGYGYHRVKRGDTAFTDTGRLLLKGKYSTLSRRFSVGKSNGDLVAPRYSRSTGNTRPSLSPATENRSEATEAHRDEEDKMRVKRTANSTLDVHRAKRSGIFFEEQFIRQWSSTYIPYYVDPQMTPEQEAVVDSAVNAIQEATCLNFVKQTQKPSGNFIFYSVYASPAFCGISNIGMQKSGNNVVYLSFLCQNQDSKGIAIHETLHSIGVAHEHVRTDRDDHIRINWENIDPNNYAFFALNDAKMFTSYGVPYAYDSIMHYKNNVAAKATASGPSMSATNGNGYEMGQRTHLSQNDIMLINKMYCKAEYCTDRLVYCGVWANRGKCQTSTWMQQNCRKSCDLC
ncbi:unnamed protein product [Bursaphelenchus okinawaensis]|uniref:Metalloendopeptidase n=1 Tax=Bursaphelenchus okinawaensis TaxID=465554 RepID=A0A811KCF2_9BILA|nr:unnamed protein product [Bursaphelenchus okinawaensis]CAG9101626.1 unnamed protein product [Bursaphelenchus okinawaensis]